MAVPLAPAVPCTKLPMPIQKAMTSPASSPTTAPCDKGQRKALAPIRIQGAPHVPTHPHGAGGHGGSGDTHCGVGAREEHAEAEEPQERTPHHAEDADGSLRGHGLQHQPCAPGGARASGPSPHLGSGARGPTAPCLPAAQVPAWRTHTPSPGIAAHNRELGRGVGCHGGAGDPSTVPAPRLPLPTHPAAWRAAWPATPTAQASAAAPGPPWSPWPAS